MEILYTKEKEWLVKWDSYILEENRGSHLLLSDWNKSFISYGFDFEVCICIEKDRICGGFTAVIAKAMFFKFYVVPFGPIVSAGYEGQLNKLISAVPERANFYGSCYCHITIPSTSSINQHVFDDSLELPTLKTAKKGHLFKYVYASNGLNWIDLKKAPDEESLLNSFRASVRRYIRSSQRKELEMKFLESEKDIKLGYDLCLENARNNNYSLRDWVSFKATLITMVVTKKAKFLGAFHQGNIKGAALIIQSGNYNTYILGGTKKEKPDFLAGHFLHWEAIKLSFQDGLSGYNISLGGSKGVVHLKNSYADEQIFFKNSKYHWVLKYNYFTLYLFLEKRIKPHKKTVSKFLSIFRK